MSDWKFPLFLWSSIVDCSESPVRMPRMRISLLTHSFISCVFHSQSDVLNEADEMGRYCGTDWRRWDILTNGESSVSIAGQRQTGCRLQFGPRSFRRTSIVAETVYRRSKRSRAQIDAGNFRVRFTASQPDVNNNRSISIWNRVNSVG